MRGSRVATRGQISWITEVEQDAQPASQAAGCSLKGSVELNCIELNLHHRQLDALLKDPLN